MFLISWILILEYMFNVHIFKDFFHEAHIFLK